MGQANPGIVPQRSADPLLIAQVFHTYLPHLDELLKCKVQPAEGIERKRSATVHDGAVRMPLGKLLGLSVSALVPLERFLVPPGTQQYGPGGQAEVQALVNIACSHCPRHLSVAAAAKVLLPVLLCLEICLQRSVVLPVVVQAGRTLDKQ